MTEPGAFNLNTRVTIEKLGERKLAIVKLIKSRIIRKDAEKIIEIAGKIRAVDPKLQISLVCTRNICGKSLKLLDENEIDVIYREL